MSLRRFSFGLALFSCTLMLCCSQSFGDIFNGSGTSGFGGSIGGSTMNWTDNGTTVTVDFTKGGGDFNDRFVLYLDTGAGGRNAIDADVNDRADPLRSAISYMEAATGLSLTLPTGFQASHAIAIDTGFGGLWSIPAAGPIGDNGLGFVSAVGNPTSNTQGTFQFSFNLADLGLTPNSGAKISFVGTYLNPFGGAGGLGFASNEGYGSGFPADNIGQDSFAFSGQAFSYVTSVPEPTSVSLLTLAALIAVFRRRRQCFVTIKN